MSHFPYGSGTLALFSLGLQGQGLSSPLVQPTNISSLSLHPAMKSHRQQTNKCCTTIFSCKPNWRRCNTKSAFPQSLNYRVIKPRETSIRCAVQGMEKQIEHITNVFLWQLAFMASSASIQKHFCYAFF